jgi:hypothetical protein
VSLYLTAHCYLQLPFCGCVCGETVTVFLVKVVSGAYYETSPQRPLAIAPFHWQSPPSLLWLPPFAVLKAPRVLITTGSGTHPLHLTMHPAPLVLTTGISSLLTSHVSPFSSLVLILHSGLPQGGGDAYSSGAYGR